MTQAESLLAQALELPDDERARLALSLSQSLEAPLDASAQARWESTWVEEITRRIERIKDGTARTVTAEEALARARAKLDARRADA